MTDTPEGAKRTNRHIEALKKIRDFDFGSVTLTDSEREIIEMAAEALEPKKAETGVAAKVLELKNFLFKTPKLMFAAAPDVAEAANAAGLTSIRGKEWTKSSMTGFLTKARELIAEDMAKTTASAPVAQPVIAQAVVRPEKDVIAASAVPAHVAAAAGVTMGDDIDDLDDLAELNSL